MAENKKALLGNTSYDVIREIVSLYGPAALTLYSGLAVLWEWDNTDKVVASAGLVLTFLGVIFKVSNVQYAKSDAKYDGDVLADVDGSYIVEMNQATDLANKSELVLKVKADTSGRSV